MAYNPSARRGSIDPQQTALTQALGQGALQGGFQTNTARRENEAPEDPTSGTMPVGGGPVVTPQPPGPTGGGMRSVMNPQPGMAPGTTDWNDPRNFGPVNVQNAQSSVMPPGTLPTSAPGAPPLGAAAAGMPAGSPAWSVAPRTGAPPAGWDAKNWADPNMQSVKYRAGRLLYGLNKPSDVGKKVLSPEFQKAFPGATFNGKDWLDFKGALSDGSSGVPVNGIDVLLSADQGADTSGGLWWGAPDDNAGGGGSMGTTAGRRSGPALFGALGGQQNNNWNYNDGGGGGDLLDRILEMLGRNKLFDPQENFMLRGR